MDSRPSLIRRRRLTAGTAQRYTEMICVEKMTGWQMKSKNNRNLRTVSATCCGTLMWISGEHRTNRNKHSSTISYDVSYPLFQNPSICFLRISMLSRSLLTRLLLACMNSLSPLHPFILPSKLLLERRFRISVQAWKASYEDRSIVFARQSNLAHCREWEATPDANFGGTRGS
jgi:hypothetical protein